VATGVLILFVLAVMKAKLVAQFVHGLTKQYKNTNG
jgi:hypothetical protein